MKRNVSLLAFARLLRNLVLIAIISACSDGGNDGSSSTGDTNTADIKGDANTDISPPDVAELSDLAVDVFIDTTSDISDAVDADTAPDMEVTDLVTPHEDTTVLDVQADDTTDTENESDTQVASATRVFRVKSLQIVEPTLCYDIDQNETCDDLTAIVNALIQGQLDAIDEPLDLLGIFPEYTFPSQNKPMVFGEGVCQRDRDAGQIVGCNIVNNSGGAVFDNVFNKDSGICSLDPEINAPCFATTTAPSLSLNIVGILFEFNNAKAAGGFDSGTAPELISPGLLLAFLSVAQTKTIGLELGEPEPTPLFDLLKNSQTTVLDDGTVGWTFHLSFTAEHVPESL